ncbi:MAG: cyclic nucleotide-binding domain-containing protein, partial [Pseudomonadota bacterium]
GYNKATRQPLKFGFGFRFAQTLQRRLRIARPLANQLADRFEFLLIYRILADELIDFNKRRIRPLLGERVGDILNDILCLRQDETIQAIDALRLQYPDYADSLERLFLLKAGVRLEETAFDDAKEQMLIGTELHRDLLRDVENTRRTSHTRPTLDLGLKTRDLVSAHPLFKDLPGKQQKAIRRMMRPQFATPREKLIRRGDRGDAAYFIASGAVEVQAPSHTVRLGRGDVFGEIALMTGGRRSADVVALGYCQLLSLGAHDFKSLMDQHPDLREHVVALAEMRQLMNTDKAEHEIEDPVVPQFASEDPAKDQGDVVEAKGDQDGQGDQATPAEEAPTSEEQENETVNIEVTEEIKVTETITVSSNKEKSAEESSSAISADQATAPDKEAKKETASG